MATVVFGEVIADVVRVELKDRRITIVARVDGPHPEFEANEWRVHGDDGGLIYTVDGSKRPSMMQPARGVFWTTTVYCPVEIDGGPDIVPPVK